MNSERNFDERDVFCYNIYGGGVQPTAREGHRNMRKQFKAGDAVTLVTGYAALGLQSGSQGRVWVRYETEPPAYEVTFCAADGAEFDLTVREDEIATCSEDAGAALPGAG